MTYRHDIDGLRAIAALIIVFFHVGLPGFEGAFYGPDLFFVLSGYLIASRIFDQFERGEFRLSDFYYRRIRRLFPAYAVMLLVTWAFAYAWFLPADFREFGKSLLASSVYLSNILFYREAGYFDVAAHFKPLLHTWSLSVEEQFYLLFPLLALFLAGASRRRYFFIFFAISVLSFIAAVIGVELDKQMAFYLFPFRIWEIGIGVLIATGCYNLPPITHRWSRESLAVIGMALILGPMFFYTPQMKFPGLAALPVCAGTWLIIQLSDERGTIIQKLLSLQLAVFLGRLSYSLYLWHWPIFSIYSYIDTNGIDALEMTVILAVIFIAAYLSYRYVENPLRFGRLEFVRSKLLVYASAGVLSAILMALGFSIYLADGMAHRYSKDIRRAIAATSLFGDLSKDCVRLDNSKLKDLEYCEIGRPLTAKRYTLIWGDSHSPTYRFAFRDALPGKDALMVWSGGCPALFDAEVDEEAAPAATDLACQRRNMAVKRLIASDPRIDSVIILGRWSYYGRGEGLGADQSNRIKVWPAGQTFDASADQYTVYLKQFEMTIRQIRSHGLKVFVIEQPPEFARFHARTFVMNRLTAGLSPHEKVEITELERRAIQDRQGPVMALLDRLEEDGDVTVLRTHDLVCAETKCSLLHEGTPLYFDNNHLAASMVRKNASLFDPVVEYQKQLE